MILKPLVKKFPETFAENIYSREALKWSYSVFLEFKHYVKFEASQPVPCVVPIFPFRFDPRTSIKWTGTSTDSVHKLQLKISPSPSGPTILESNFKNTSMEELLSFQGKYLGPSNSVNTLAPSSIRTSEYYGPTIPFCIPDHFPNILGGDEDEFIELGLEGGLHFLRSGIYPSKLIEALTLCLPWSGSIEILSNKCIVEPEELEESNDPEDEEDEEESKELEKSDETVISTNQTPTPRSSDGNQNLREESHQKVKEMNAIKLLKTICQANILANSPPSMARSFMFFFYLFFSNLNPPFFSTFQFF
eukprot:TRINITY_DN16941_c0_g1_i1.p1 TRINITY_DN16941_c0_g1~~TRINITY_DN16941_c0_g1_i1.p1  ORF type:complete len:305 (-),score=71.80 TRINITY_DN16941_c0_g1_i1:131-1045(-)